MAARKLHIVIRMFTLRFVELFCRLLTSFAVFLLLVVCPSLSVVEGAMRKSVITTAKTTPEALCFESLVADPFICVHTTRRPPTSGSHSHAVIYPLRRRAIDVSSTLKTVYSRFFWFLGYLG
mmetsp:Transcript_82790/g.138167  ORF Transcript_82790/g.138167 Transcript_82790/m.138167 type:complete len:122 (-) Transcript_82790:330-695(-)